MKSRSCETQRTSLLPQLQQKQTHAELENERDQKSQCQKPTKNGIGKEAFLNSGVSSISSETQAASPGSPDLRLTERGSGLTGPCACRMLFSSHVRGAFQEKGCGSQELKGFRV